MNVFFTSDHHFGHKNIIKYDERPFTSVEEMNETMIERWNSVVGPRDLVYHVGDLSFLNLEGTQKIVQRLNGLICLIEGNHDRARSKTWWKKTGIHVVEKRSREVNYIVNDYIFDILVQHEPVLDEMPISHLQQKKYKVQINGHVHTSWITKNWKEILFINVGVPVWDYYPVSVEQIKKLISEEMLKQIKKRINEAKE